MITQILKIDLTLGKTSERNKIENDKQNRPIEIKGGFVLRKFFGRVELSETQATFNVRRCEMTSAPLVTHKSAAHVGGYQGKREDQVESSNLGVALCVIALASGLLMYVGWEVLTGIVRYIKLVF